MSQIEILKAAKKKKRLSVRDFWYYDLEELVHADLLNKSFPKKGRGAGWPCYKLSRRGLKVLAKARKQHHLTSRG